MDNHVHLILVPEDGEGLRAALGEAHRRYTRAVNFRVGWRGHLFQSRFASYPMDDAHLMVAVRYVENNPVAALVEHVPNWRAMLRHGLEAGRIGPGGEPVLAAIEARLRTGRLLGAKEWIASQEQASGRRLTPQRPGPRSRRAPGEAES